MNHIPRVSSPGVLLPELVVSMVLLLTMDAGLLQETGSIPLLAGLLEPLDRYNHLAPGHERDDHEDLAWPGIMGKAERPRGRMGLDHAPNILLLGLQLKQ